MNRLSANSTKISYKTGSGDSATFKELEFLMEVPEFGGAPEKIDVTVLSDKVKKYRARHRGSGRPGRSSSCMTIPAPRLPVTGCSRGWPTPARAGHLPAGPIPTARPMSSTRCPPVKMDAGTLNGALTFSCTMVLQSDIKVTNPA